MKLSHLASSNRQPVLIMGVGVLTVATPTEIESMVDERMNQGWHWSYRFFLRFVCKSEAALMCCELG